MIKYEHPLFKNYFANEDGQVFNGDKLLKGTKATVGYWQYYIKGKTVLAHRFIYEAINNCLLEKSEIINHLDHNKLNNRISNLEKTNQKGNIHHYFDEIGKHLITQPNMEHSGKSRIGYSNTKLTKQDVVEIIKLSLQGVENEVLASMFGVHSRYVSLIRHKKRWKSVWVELGLESSETIPSGSRPASAVEAEDALILS